MADNCLNGANAAPAGFAQSMCDITGDGFSDITDISALAGQFGKQGGAPVAPGSALAGYDARMDGNYDRFIDITDLALMGGVFGKSC